MEDREEDQDDLKVLGERVYEDGLYNIEAALDLNEQAITDHYYDPGKRMKELVVFRRLRSRAIIDACSQAEKGARMMNGIVGKQAVSPEDDTYDEIEDLLTKVANQMRIKGKNGEE